MNKIVITHNIGFYEDWIEVKLNGETIYEGEGFTWEYAVKPVTSILKALNYDIELIENEQEENDSEHIL
jgi:hypothetical protein